MIYPVKVKDRNGKVKYEVSSQECLYKFWKALGDGMYNEFIGMQVQPELKAKKYKKLECIRSGCENIFQQTSLRNIYCSTYCTKSATAKRQKEMRRKNRPKTQCRRCKKDFVPVGSQRYCGSPCKRPAFQKNAMETKNCQHCNTVFISANPSKIMCNSECGANKHRDARRLQGFKDRKKKKTFGSHKVQKPNCQ